MITTASRLTKQSNNKSRKVLNKQNGIWKGDWLKTERKTQKDFIAISKSICYSPSYNLDLKRTLADKSVMLIEILSINLVRKKLIDPIFIILTKFVSNLPTILQVMMLQLRGCYILRNHL